MANEFEKDYSCLTKDPELQEIIDNNFHFFKLKTPEEQLRIIKRNHGVDGDL